VKSKSASSCQLKSSPPAVINGTVYYVNSATGNDAANGLTPSTPWKTLTKVSNVAYTANGFKAGDQIWLTGTFTQQLYIDYARSYGSAANPIVITTAPTAPSPAVIRVSRLSAISLYSTAGSNLGIRISNLHLIGDNTTTTAGKTTGGVFLWHSSASAITGLFIDKVVASGFTEGGIVTGRDSTAGWITDVTVTDTLAYGNPGELRGWSESVRDTDGARQSLISTAFLSHHVMKVAASA
jgi:hypothetical protein